MGLGEKEILEQIPGVCSLQMRKILSLSEGKSSETILIQEGIVLCKQNNKNDCKQNNKDDIHTVVASASCLWRGHGLFLSLQHCVTNCTPTNSLSCQHPWHQCSLLQLHATPSSALGLGEGVSNHAPQPDPAESFHLALKIFCCSVMTSSQVCLNLSGKLRTASMSQNESFAGANYCRVVTQCLCVEKLWFSLLLFPIADSYTVYCQPSLLSLHLPISRFLLVHLCLGLFFLQCIGMHPLRWHLMMLLLSALLYYSPWCLHHWDSGLIALVEHHTNNQIISGQRITYLFITVYITCTHPRITKPKGNFHLGTLSENKQQEVIRIRQN